METTTDYIPDIEKEIESKTRLFPIVIWAGFIFLALVAFDMYRELRRTTRVSAGELLGMSIFLVIPLTGLILLKLKKKAGWVICVCYFGFVTLIWCSYLAQNIYRLQRIDFSGLLRGLAMAVFALSAAITISLVSAGIRKYLGVTRKMLVLTLTIVSVIDLALVILILKS